MKICLCGISVKSCTYPNCAAKPLPVDYIGLLPEPTGDRLAGLQNQVEEVRKLAGDLQVVMKLAKDIIR